jgi:hypothetical protein
LVGNFWCRSPTQKCNDVRSIVLEVKLTIIKKTPNFSLSKKAQRFIVLYVGRYGINKFTSAHLVIPVKFLVFVSVGLVSW